MKEITVRELQSKIADALNPAIYHDEPVTITRNGVPAAVIISVRDYERLKKLKEISK